jgi:hypothetical protein
MESWHEIFSKKTLGGQNENCKSSQGLKIVQFDLYDASQVRSSQSPRILSAAIRTDFSFGCAASIDRSPNDAVAFHDSDIQLGKSKTAGADYAKMRTWTTLENHIVSSPEQEGRRVSVIEDKG